MAIVLFAVATFFYSYQATANSFTLSQSVMYPYRTIALAFVGVGSVSMVFASISYSRKTKNPI